MVREVQPSVASTHCSVMALPYYEDHCGLHLSSNWSVVQMLASHWSPVASLVSCAPLRLWCMWPESPALTAHTLELRTLHDVP